MTSGPQLVIFCGLQGSGKTTYYHRRLAATHAHVSKDLMPHNRRKEARQRELIVELLLQGRSVVVDNTNPTPAERVPLIALGREHGATVAGWFFAADLHACLARNARRQARARVPVVGILATAKRLQPPTVEEGYDVLHVVEVDDRTRIEAPEEGNDAAMEDIDEQSVDRIVAAARAVAASNDTTPAPGSAEPLQVAVKEASADERSAAAQALADDRQALQALHAALRALDVEPS